MRLLVSVRSADEAITALNGGAQLIDVKEPRNGPLGMADLQTIHAIRNAVGKKAPLSVAMGELNDDPSTKILPDDCDYLKFGLSKMRDSSWRQRLLQWRSRLSTAVVPATYADAEIANCPPPEEIVDFVIEQHFPVMLIDTYEKAGRSVFDWIPTSVLKSIASKLRSAGVEFALAGSISREHLPQLRWLAPDWVAVRGAVCQQSNRISAIDSTRVQEFSTLLHAQSC